MRRYFHRLILIVGFPPIFLPKRTLTYHHSNFPGFRGGVELGDFPKYFHSSGISVKYIIPIPSNVGPLTLTK